MPFSVVVLTGADLRVVRDCTHSAIDAVPPLLRIAVSPEACGTCKSPLMYNAEHALFLTKHVFLPYFCACSLFLAFFLRGCYRRSRIKRSRPTVPRLCTTSPGIRITARLKYLPFPNPCLAYNRRLLFSWSRP